MQRHKEPATQEQAKPNDHKEQTKTKLHKEWDLGYYFFCWFCFFFSRCVLFSRRRILCCAWLVVALDMGSLSFIQIGHFFFFAVEMCWKTFTVFLNVTSARPKKAKKLRRNKGRHSKSALFRGKLVFFTRKQRKERKNNQTQNKQNKKTKKNKEGLGQVRWPFGPLKHSKTTKNKKTTKKKQKHLNMSFFSYQSRISFLVGAFFDNLTQKTHPQNTKKNRISPNQFLKTIIHETDIFWIK